MTFKAWMIDDEDEASARPYDTFDASDAAEEHAEYRHDNGDGSYDGPCEVAVVDGAGVQTRWTVTVEWSPSFYASESKDAFDAE